MYINAVKPAYGLELTAKTECSEVGRAKKGHVRAEVLGRVFRYMLTVFLYLVSQILMSPGFSCLRAPQRVGDSTYGCDSNGQISALWPVNAGNLPCVRCKNLICHRFLFFLEATGNLVTLKSFTCCVTVANGCEPEWYHEGPSFEQPQELWALAWNGMLYYVQSHGNLNLAAAAASEIASASRPSAPVTRVDLGVGCRLGNLSFTADDSFELL